MSKNDEFLQIFSYHYFIVPIKKKSGKISYTFQPYKIACLYQKRDRGTLLYRSSNDQINGARFVRGVRKWINMHEYYCPMYFQTQLCLLNDSNLLFLSVNRGYIVGRFVCSMRRWPMHDPTDITKILERRKDESKTNNKNLRKRHIRLD